MDNIIPVKHKPNVFGGNDSIEKAKEEVQKMAQDYAKKYATKLLKQMNPFQAYLEENQP